MINIRRELQPFEFWPYTTVVLDRIIEFEPEWLRGEGGDPCGKRAIEEMRQDLLARFNEVGIKCELDNKTAFGLRDPKTGGLIYVGFYDGRLVIGHSIRSDGWNKPQRAPTP